MGLDKKDDRNLLLSLQFSVPDSDSNSGTSQSSKTTICSINCKNINSGIDIANNHISKTINLSHCQVIVISEEFAKLGIGNHIKLLANNVAIKADCSIVVSECSAKTYLESVKPALEKQAARFYKSTFNLADYGGYTVNTKLTEFYSAMQDEYQDACVCLGGIIEPNNLENNQQINGNYEAGKSPLVDSDKIDNIGIAIFSHDKMIGKLTGLDSLCHLLVTTKIKKTNISISNPDDKNNYINLSISSERNPKCKINLESNPPEVYLNIYLTGYLESNNFEQTLDQNKFLTDYCANYIKSQIESYLTKCSREYLVDIAYLSKYILKDYKTIKDLENSSWLNKYQHATFHVNVNLKLQS